MTTLMKFKLVSIELKPLNKKLLMPLKRLPSSISFLDFRNLLKLLKLYQLKLRPVKLFKMTSLALKTGQKSSRTQKF